MQRIYLDYAATTPVRQEVAQAMLSCMTGTYGNPSGNYTEGREAHALLESARRQTAEAIGAMPREIFFTSGGTESDNWAIRQFPLEKAQTGHIIVSSVEHHAVLHACRAMERGGWRITCLPVDSFGMVHPDVLEKAIQPDTVLVSVMTANNEVGTIQPIRELAEIAHGHGALFHTDAVQAVGSLPISVAETAVDLLSISAHKVYGPKGVGALYVRKGTRMHAFLEGGAQEKGMRAGTENVPGIVGMGLAMHLAHEELSENVERLIALRNQLISGVLQNIPDASLTGHPQKRLPGNASFLIPGVENTALVARLDLLGISASGGSACTSGSPEPSHVLLAMGKSPQEAHCGVRFSIGKNTTAADIERLISVLPGLVAELRA